MKALAPISSATRNNVNKSFSGVTDKLRESFMSGGGGANGKFGTANLQADLARRGSLADADNTAGTNAVNTQQSITALIQNLLGMDLGGGQTSNYLAQQDNTGLSQTAETGKTTGSGWSVGVGKR